MDIMESIFQRISIRSYESQPAATEELEVVRRAGEEAEALTQTEMQFHLRTHEDMGKEVKGLIGNYGKTIHAPHYIVLAARESDGYLTDAGFRFEQMVLEATRMGLGTCWVGLMFKEASLRTFLGLDDSWRVIALTPIGQPAAPSLKSRTLRALAGSAARKPLEKNFFWQRHGAALPTEVLAHEQMSQILEASRWAPSWINRQPWFFLLTGHEVMVYKNKHKNREGKDYHLLDCGIAMAHLHIAAKAQGRGRRWELGNFEIPGAPDVEAFGRYNLEIA